MRIDDRDSVDRIGPHADRDHAGPRITAKHVIVAALAFAAVAGGLALLQIPDRYQPVIVFAVPALVLAVMIILNPFIGFYVYILFEYFRPYDLIPALLPLKIPIGVISLSVVSWLLRLARTKRMFWNGFGWLYFSFVALIGFTVVTAENYFYALEVFKEAVIVFAMFVVGINVISTHDRFRKVVWLMLAIHLFLALRGIYNYLTMHAVDAGQQTSGVVGTSFLADENDFALALNVMIPFAFFAVLYSRRLYTRAIAAFIMICLAFGVVSSFSRGGWVGLVAALGFCLLRTKRKVASFSFAIVLAAALLLVAPSEYWDEVRTISDTGEATAVTRINYWKAAFRMFLDHPVVGVGANNGGVHMPDYVTGFDSPLTQWGRAFHGTLPQVLAELGLIGIALYVAMLVIAIRHLVRARRDAIEHRRGLDVAGHADAVTGAIIAYLVTATFLSTAYYPQLWTLFTLTVILVRCRETLSEGGNEMPAGGFFNKPRNMGRSE